MKILHVKGNPDYATLQCGASEGNKRFDLLQADPIEDYCESVCRFLDRDKVVGNFTHVSDSALLFDDVVYDAMGEFIEAAGQVLPLCIKGYGKRYLLNVLENCNSVNIACSNFYQEDWRKTLLNKSLCFHENRVYSFSSLFKIPELEYIPILTFSGKKGHEHDFYETYRSSKLTGLVFDIIWDSKMEATRI